MKINTKDVAAGGVFIAIGAYFALDAMMHLRVGSAVSMGPGYFPIMLGGVLIAVGIGVMLLAIGKASEAFAAIPWRGLLLVMGAIVFFGATVRGLGIAPSLLVSAFMGAMATRDMPVLQALIAAVALTFFNILVFVYVLGLPYPVIGPWLMAR